MSSEDSLPEIERKLTKLGTLQFSHSDNVVHDCECDRLVISGHSLMACSFVTTPGQVKAVRAMLHAKKGRVNIQASDIDVIEPSKACDGWTPRRTNPACTPDEDGYDLWVHKLEYARVHVTFVSKSNKLLLYVSPEAIWSRLMDSDNYETPLIKAWMPHVMGRLVEKRYLRECKCFRANAATLEIPNVAALDEIVTDGLKAGKIFIP